MVCSERFLFASWFQLDLLQRQAGNARERRAAKCLIKEGNRTKDEKRFALPPRTLRSSIELISGEDRASHIFSSTASRSGE